MAQTKILVFEGNKTFFKNIEVDEVFEFMGFSFSAHKDYKNHKIWLVTENSSGAIASHIQGKDGKMVDGFKGHKNKKDAVNTAKKNIENFILRGGNLTDKIKSFIDKFHPKPKYISVLDLIKLKII